VIHKSEPTEVILKAIAWVHAGEPWLDRATMGRVLQTFPGDKAVKANSRLTYPDSCRAKGRGCGCASKKRAEQGHRRSTSLQRAYAAQPPKLDLQEAGD
jgi:hypothetical protein